MASPDELTTLHITRLKECSGWTEWMLPSIQQRAVSMMESLLATDAAGEARAKGFVQGLRWVMNLPAVTLGGIQRSESDAVQQSESTQQDEFYAQAGRKSPFRLVPPGDTKAESATN